MFNFRESGPFNAIFEQAGYETTTFIIELGLIFFLVLAFILYQILKAGLRSLTRNYGENMFTKHLRRETKYREIIVRFLLEGCMELGLVASISLMQEESWRFGNVWDAFSAFMAVVSLCILALTPLYIGRAAYLILKSKSTSITRKN